MNQLVASNFERLSHQKGHLSLFFLAPSESFQVSSRLGQLGLHFSVSKNLAAKFSPTGKTARHHVYAANGPSTSVATQIRLCYRSPCSHTPPKVKRIRRKVSGEHSDTAVRCWTQVDLKSGERSSTCRLDLSSCLVRSLSAIPRGGGNVARGVGGVLRLNDAPGGVHSSHTCPGSRTHLSRGSGRCLRVAPYLRVRGGDHRASMFLSSHAIRKYW